MVVVNYSLAIGRSWTEVCGGFVGRLGTLPTKHVPSKSQTRKHLRGKGADKYIFLAADSTDTLDVMFPEGSCFEPLSLH